jgi:cytochrome c556
MLSGALIGLAPIGAPQEPARAISGVDIIAARQASLDMSSITFRSMVDAVKSGREPKTLAYPATALTKWAKALPGMFPPGTGKGETSAVSQALPAIWRDRAGFDQAAAIYADATVRLSELASANDTAGFSRQLGEVDQACLFCHARFKDGDQGPPQR